MRLKYLINDDKEKKEKYFKDWGKKLTFDVIKYYRPSGPLIVSLLMAIATGNTVVVTAIYSDFPELFKIKIHTADMYMQLLDACYKKVELKDLSQNINQNLNQQQQLLQSLREINSISGKFTELFGYDTFSVRDAVLLSVALRIACLYHRIEIAKSLLSYSKVHDDTTFVVIKDFMNWISGVIKYLNDTSKIVSVDGGENIVIHKKQLSAFMAMRKEIKEHVYCLRRFEEIKEKVEKNNKRTLCTLSLCDTPDKNIIIPADIGLKILEYCPFMYKKSELNKNNCLIS